MKDPVFYLIFIREQISLALSFTEGLKTDGDIKSQMALERALEVMADATKHLPDEWKNAYPDIPWSRIIGFRNVLAHDYVDIHHADLLDIAQTHVPELKQAIDALIEQHAPQLKDHFK